MITFHHDTTYETNKDLLKDICRTAEKYVVNGMYTCMEIIFKYFQAVRITQEYAKLTFFSSSNNRLVMTNLTYYLR